ncbi:MAG TPA: winged helix-turn-helix transcriptional regulator [Dissulfurispiraceae bacterium]|nr:winged helix-turn-helix transcriptional regulator [Dissulfurispiraceae bacterium]
MNMERSTPPGTDHFRSLQILDELSSNDSLTQRDLSKRLGIALGLVNSYIKNLIAKGFVTVKTIPPKRYAYYLTPKGFSEKTRLAYHLFQDYTRIYREAKGNFRSLFSELGDQGIRTVAFAGSDEVAEVAYITLQETRLSLAGVYDVERSGERFFDLVIRPLHEIVPRGFDCIVVTSHLRGEQLYKGLISQGVKKKDIRTIFPQRKV